MVELDGLFDYATSIAKGDVTHHQVGDKMQSITPEERQMWAQIAAKIGLVGANLSRGYDERQIDKDLDKLEKLLEETDKLNAKAVAREQLASQIDAIKTDDNMKS